MKRKARQLIIDDDPGLRLLTIRRQQDRLDQRWQDRGQRRLTQTGGQIGSAQNALPPAELD